MQPAPIQDSRELGLVLAQQLLDVEDLHYGLWPEGLEPSLANLPQAQRNYTALLLEAIGRVPRPRRVLDVGCGVGGVLVELRRAGYLAEGLSPSRRMNERARERLRRCGYADTPVHDSRFEDVDPVRAGCFDAVLFGESFQYTPMSSALERARRLLGAGGRIVICDFFKTDAAGDGGPGDGAFGGGHPWRDFAPAVRASGLRIERDEDLMPLIAPNLALVEDLLQRRLAPALGSIDSYLSLRHRLLHRLLHFALRRRIEKVRFKYLSGHRSPQVFARYKTYRLIELRAAAPG